MRGVEQTVRVEEIEAMRKLMKKYPKGAIPLPDKNTSTDFLEIPKTSTP